MKHSIAGLTELVHRYYPRGRPYGPDYKNTEEYRRLVDAVRSAGTDYDHHWRPMLRRLRARFPDRELRDLAIHLVAGNVDASYPAALALPLLQSDELSHELGFHVSILAPYYVVYSTRLVRAEDDLRAYKGKRCDLRLDLSPAEQPDAQVLTQEIEATYAYEPMPPEIGNVVVPDVATNGRALGKATIYDCLLSDDWGR